MFAKGHIPWNKGKLFLAGMMNPMFGVHRYGTKSPHYGKMHSEETKEKMSKNKRDYFETHPNPMKGKKRPDLAARNKLRKGLTFKEIYGDRENEMRKKASSPMEKHPLWQGGKSFEPYTLAFNKELRERIMKRDGYLCQICWFNNGRLAVHHIDYNKKNSKENNLITLCTSCHSKTNGITKNRHWWEAYFKQKMRYRTVDGKIVPVGEEYFGGQLL